MARAASRRQGNVPADITSFVNRRTELTEAKRLVFSSRLITLTGPGGVGKTRLALRAARDIGPSFPDGVWFVDLAPLQDRVLLADTVVQVLEIGDQSSRSRMDVLIGYLRNKRLLLVLDNCERVSTECAVLADTLLRAVPGLHILVTSRHSLGITSEHIMTVAPLEAPDPEWMGSPRVGPEHHAVTLFTERSKAAAPGFALTRRNEAAVARLCQRLDGIPLAIELAAARTRAFSVDELVSRLDDHSRLMIPAPRTQALRHSTLHATLTWSYELCTEAEQRMWSRVSVFSGGFDLAAAESVCSGEDIIPESVYGLVGTLVDKSVLTREEHAGEVRYRLLDTVRQFGLERLQDSGEEHTVRLRHRDWFLRLAERGEAEWFGAHQVEWFQRLRREHANLRVALNTCLSEDGESRAGLHMAATLWFYWLACGFVAEGCHWVERALELDTRPSSERAAALWVDGYMATFQGDNPAAMRALEEARDLAHRLDDESTLAYVTQILGLAALGRGDMSEAEALLEDALARHKALNHFDANVMVCPVMLAYAAVGLDDLDRAVSLSQQCRTTSDAHGDLWAQSWALWLLSLVEWTRGRSHEAGGYARACLRIKQIFHDILGMAFAIDMLAWTAAAEGENARAAVLLGAAQEAWQTMGEPLADAPQLVESHERTETNARRALSEEEFDRAFRHGAELDLDEAIDYALTSGPAPAT